MGKNIVEKIIESHLVSGEAVAGKMVSLRVDQVYTQDATGTMAWLEFEAIGIDRIKVPLAVSYVDHNTIQSDFMNPDDHAFLQSVAARYGAWFSKPGNGISHQVHLERFAAPGKIALGTDSHTPTGGGIGMLAIGVGGLEAASVLAGEPFEITMPKVVNVRLTGRLQRPHVTAMDVILELLRRLTVKGGVGKIFEYSGPGVKELSVPERATITNMGAELGATTSVFPSDEITRRFLRAQGREGDWLELSADPDARYAEVIELNLSEIEPLIAQPHSPDNVVPVRELSGKRVDQVCIGSCTNSSYSIMRQVASILRGRTIAGHVSLLVNPGSRQVYEMLARDGSIADMIAAGARILESACGPCIGMGGAPGTGQVSLRSYNRNFKGRSGTKDAFVYLASPIVCAIAALRGEIIDPRDAGIDIEMPFEVERFHINDNLLIPPRDNYSDVKVIKGPNIKDVPVRGALEEDIEATVLLKLGDNITTDDIMPAGSKILPLRSNIPAISEYVFHNIEPGFAKKALELKEKGGVIIIGGENYGQGSSREHAALAPMYLGLRAVIAKSFARIHRANLINFGIIPLVFKDPADYERIKAGDPLQIKDIKRAIQEGKVEIEILNTLKKFSFTAIMELNERERALLKEGGLLAWLKHKGKNSEKKREGIN